MPFVILNTAPSLRYFPSRLHLLYKDMLFESQTGRSHFSYPCEDGLPFHPRSKELDYLTVIAKIALMLNLAFSEGLR